MSIETTIRHPNEPDKYFTVSKWDDGTVWLCNELGEGMGFNSYQLFKAIEQFFKENH